MIFVMIGIMMLILGIVYFQITSDAKYRDGKLFLITITKQAYESEEVQKLQHDFIKTVRMYYGCFLFGGTFFHIICLSYFSSYMMIVLIVWLLLFFAIAYLPLKHARQKLKELKKLRHWPVQIDQEVHVDLALSRYMEQVHFAKYTYILPCVLMCFVSAFAYVNKQYVLLSVSLLQVIIIILGILLLKRIPNKTYCDSTEMNIQINTLKKNAYHRSFLFMCMSDASLLISMILYLETLLVFILFMIMLFVAIVCLILAIVQITRFQQMARRILENDKQTVYHQDCDDYWQVGFLGMSYNNPHDPHAFVSSPNGMQAVPNMAKPIFKYAFTIGFGCVIIFFSWVFGFPYILDLQGTLVDVRMQQNVLSVDSTFYQASWNIDDIVDVEMVDDLGEGKRVRGTDAFVYGVGEYEYDRYGRCEVYLALLHSPYIILHTANSTFIINDDDEGQTEKIFHELQNEVRK